MLGVLRFGLSGHRNRDGIRFIVVAGEGSTIVDLLQFHAVVIDHTVGRNRAAAALDELPCCCPTIQCIQFLRFGAATVQIHIVSTANSSEVRKIRNDCDLLAAEGQVDQILQFKKLQLVSHRLKLCGFAGIETVQPFGEVVQLFLIDREHLRALEHRVKAVDLLDLAVSFDRVANFQSLQQLHAVCVLVVGDRERDSCHAVFRVMRIAEHRLYHHVSSTPFSKFKTTSPYLAISSAPVIRWNASSVTSSGDARSARVILQQPTAMAFAAW